jgi:hypothetical protein
MIALAVAISDVARYEKFGARGIARALEPGAVAFLQAAPGPNFRIHNLLLDRAREVSDLEALVIVDERVEILDPALGSKVRRALADPEVAIAGSIGARGVRSIAWWEGEVSAGPTFYRHPDSPGEDLPPLTGDGWGGGPRITPPGEVDAVDGMLMALSPWAVRNLGFDEALGPKYGGDIDLCFQAREAGRRVITADLAAAHHHPLGVVDEPETWMEAHMRFAEKWEGRMAPPTATDAEWRARARASEGRAAAARLLSATRTYQIQALTRQQDREQAQLTNTLSWRVTRPLREAGRVIAESRARNPRSRE